jgi:hypothetical protein
MGIPAKHPSKAQDGLRGFCGALDDILMTGQGRFSELLTVMTLSLSGVYPDPNTSRVLKVFAASLGSFFLPAIWQAVRKVCNRGRPLANIRSIYTSYRIRMWAS